MNEVLSFDWGTTIIGILDINCNVYTPYRHKGMKEGAERVVFSAGTIVSFNGNRRDLLELFKILDLPSESESRSKHEDMSEIISSTRWPPDPGTSSIDGPGLDATYRHYFGTEPVTPPSYLQDDYAVDNWTDCHMTAELWKKWKRGEL